LWAYFLAASAEDKFEVRVAVDTFLKLDMLGYWAADGPGRTEHPNWDLAELMMG